MNDSNVGASARWTWLEANAMGGSDGQTMTKLFRNSASLSDTALLARESVQNSWDAARRFRESENDHSIPFSVVFRFEDVVGEDRESLINALDLRGLRDRRNGIQPDPILSGTVLDHLDDVNSPIRVLYVEDNGTHGLFGHPDLKKNSHLYLAMYYIGGSGKTQADGGSFGFGKSALERASRIHTVIAHSMFKPLTTPVIDKVRQRLVGFTWWPSHDVADESFEGRAVFADMRQTDGPEAEAKPTPFEDNDSSAVASSLRFKTRDPEKLADNGTSFLILDPAITPKLLVMELEKWWWPALQDHSFELTVITPDGSRLIPKPAANPFVAQFLPAYRIAIGQDIPKDGNNEKLASESWRVRAESLSNPGKLGLVVPDVAYKIDGSESDGEGYVALMRAPKMVIKYETHTKRRTPIRGAFVASEDANGLLRQTEPSVHDEWSTNESSDVNPAATRVAKEILSRIRRSVKEMAEEVAPPPRRDNHALTYFSKLLSNFLGTKKGPSAPVPSGGEPIELRLLAGPSLVVSGADNVKLEASFTVRASETAPADFCAVIVSCALHIQEDDHAGTKWPLTLTPEDPHEFIQNENGDWEGTISKADRKAFIVKSDPYSNGWTASLLPSIVRTKEWGDQ